MSRLPRLLLLTDRAQLRLGRSLSVTVAECVEAGLTHVVLRELDLDEHRRAALAAAFAASGAIVIAAHRPLPAAAGLHLPAASSQPQGRPAGRSCHSRAEVAEAAAAGFDYATLSPYAATDSKPGYGPSLPPGALAGHPIPVYALGGITPANAGQARAAGADGVAVMGAVMRAADPAAVVGELLAVLS